MSPLWFASIFRSLQVLTVTIMPTSAGSVPYLTPLSHLVWCTSSLHIASSYVPFLVRFVLSFQLAKRQCVSVFCVFFEIYVPSRLLCPRGIKRLAYENYLNSFYFLLFTLQSVLPSQSSFLNVSCTSHMYMHPPLNLHITDRLQSVGLQRPVSQCSTQSKHTKKASTFNLKSVSNPTWVF
jgi:hypothetical protein